MDSGLVTCVAGFIRSCIIDMLEEQPGKKAYPQNHPACRTNILASCAAFSQAKCLLSWEQQVDLLGGMKPLMDWFRTGQNWTQQAVTP